MSAIELPRHPGLSNTTRLRALASDTALAGSRDWVILVLAGILAACSSTFLNLGIQRVPGHAILRVVFPMALGLALVPRQGSGTVMGFSALFTAIVLRGNGFQGEGLGLGALTSLIATGPILDWTLRRVNGGWWQVLGFAVAGLASNLLALLVRGIARSYGWEKVGARPLSEWLSQAAVTYAICGILAGVISGLVLFCQRRSDIPLGEPPS